MSKLTVEPGQRIPLPSPTFPERAHVFDDGELGALNAALAARRPLLLCGKPGTGKSQIAEAAAAVLGWPIVSYTVDGRTEPRDLLYEVDFVLRLAEAQLHGAIPGATVNEVRAKLALREFTRPGPLWWAFEWQSAADLELAVDRDHPDGWKPGNGCVVLIDEIDKADAEVPNGLLEALGQGHFDVMGGRIEVGKDVQPPLVIVTTNEERELPDAFVRRCFVHALRLPVERKDFLEVLVRRGQAHFPEIAESVMLSAANLLFDARQDSPDGAAMPGMAEYFDVLRVLQYSGLEEAEQRDHVAELKRFTFDKFRSLAESGRR